MGFAVAAPMAMGALAGAMMNKSNPLMGAAMGAMGGAALGPAMSGLTSAGAAASEAALAQGMGAAGAGEAAQLAAAGEMAGAGFGAQQSAMLAAQNAGLGNAGIAHTLGSAGANPMLAKTAAFAAGGPQGGSLIQGMMNGNMSGGDMLKLGMRGMNVANQMAGPPPQPMVAPPPPSAPSRPAMPSAPAAPVRPFVTGMPTMARKRNTMWGM